MNTQSIGSKFKPLFEAEKRRIIQNSRVAVSELTVASEDMMDEMDFTTAEVDNQMRLRLRNREALYLRKIDEAMERIKSGTFGMCERCEEEIESRRLEARPTTTLCVACKEAQEKNEKVHIDGHRHKSLGKTLKLA
jgi:DnaK suppressor protein